MCSIVCYECSSTGMIIEKESCFASQFAVVRKYDVLYAEELERFSGNTAGIYALPFGPAPERVYNGTGRIGADIFIDEIKSDMSGEEIALADRLKSDYDYADELMKNEESALRYLGLFAQSDNFELIWLRAAGSDDEPPAGYSFIGYDVSYPCDYSGGFSIICDCMFICKWHGCDSEGTLFRRDFESLNDNGLFDRRKDAYDYMLRYLGEDWSERGQFYITEVFAGDSNDR